MSDQTPSNVLPHPANHLQRRSVSVGGAPLETYTEADDPSFDGIGTDTDQKQAVTPSDDGGDYICAPLSKGGSRPTAATCWLVRAFSFLDVMHAARPTVRTLLNPCYSIGVNERQQKFTFKFISLCPLLSLL